MSHCLLLLTDRLMRLIVRIPLPLILLGQLNRSAFERCASLLLLIEIIRLCPPLIQKKLAKLQIALLPRHLVETNQCHLRNLVSGISFALVFLWSKTGRRIINIPARRVQKFVFSGRLIVGNSTLNQMPQTVQLMMIFEIGKCPVHAIDDIVCVQITVL